MQISRKHRQIANRTWQHGDTEHRSSACRGGLHLEYLLQRRGSQSRTESITRGDISVNGVKHADEVVSTMDVAGSQMHGMPVHTHPDNVIAS